MIQRKGIQVLENQDIEIEIATLEAGDYIVNHRIAFRRLTIDDILKGKMINLSFIKDFLRIIAVSFRIPILYTLNEAQTAEVISNIARDEHFEQT